MSLEIGIYLYIIEFVETMKFRVFDTKKRIVSILQEVILWNIREVIVASYFKKDDWLADVS